MPGPTATFATDLQADLTTADRLLCVDRGIALGAFRASPADAVFSGSSRLRCYYLVFPRTSSEIRLERGPAAVHTPLHLVAYNVGDSYRRFAVSDRGDDSDYVAVDRARMRRLLQDEFGEVPEGAGGLLFHRFSAVQTRSLFLRQRRLFDRLRARAPAAPDAVAADASEMREAILDVLLSALASSLTGPLPPAPALPRQRTIAEDTKRHLGRHFCEPLDLDGLAKLAGVSPGHLARIFRRHVGLSIHQCLIELRLRASLELLLDMRNIADVAAQLGFAHHSHFAAAFARAFGTTPSAYLGAAPRRPGRRRLFDRLDRARPARDRGRPAAVP